MRYDEVRFVIDQHAELDFYSASSLTLHSDTLFWFRANQSLIFLEYTLREQESNSRR
jgi:hypothetical protein